MLFLLWALHSTAYFEETLIALGAIAGSFMVSYSTAKAEALSVEAPRGSMRRSERARCGKNGGAK
jgi:hypothetical protein